ncbi:MAG: PP2C family serine/threonine-protein phosphatase [Caulobacteraceae bacterium]
MWRYAAARTVGVSHVKSGTPCQDRYAHAIDGQNLIVAVSDGAGSAALSAVGAELAANKAVEHLRAHLSDPQADWPTLVIDAALTARLAVHAEAIAAGRSPRDYACTLLLIVLAGANGAALQIGDGVIAYKDADSWGYVFWPQKGEYANITNFLVQEDAEDRFEVTALKEPLREIAIMTDGLEAIALHYASKTPHEPFLEAIMGPLRAEQGGGEAVRVSVALEAFLQSDRIRSRTDDDLTLVLAIRGSA